MLGQISHSPSLYLKADPQQSLREDDIKRKPHTGVAPPVTPPSPHSIRRVARCLIDTRLTTSNSPTPPSPGYITSQLLEETLIRAPRPDLRTYRALGAELATPMANNLDSE
ncbi:unnamed protein product, partial [Iphiclides podalirius]